MKRDGPFVWIVAAATLVYCGAAAALEFPLEYMNRPDVTMNFSPSGRQVLTLSDRRPDGNWILPKFNAKQPIFTLASVGDSSRLLVFDKKREADRAYTVLYVDVNGNSDLTDDDPVATRSGPGQRNSRQWMEQFGPIKVELLVNGESTTFSFDANVYQWDDAPSANPFENWYAYLMTNCWYKSKVETGGKVIHVYFEDSNCNGTFTDRCKPADESPGNAQRPTGDSVYLFRQGKPSYYDEIVLGDLLYLDGTVYDVEINTPRELLALNPVEVSFGSLKVPAGLKQLLLYDPQEKRSVLYFEPAEQVMAPLGTYRLAMYQATRTGDAGDAWMLNACATKDCPLVTVADRTTAILPLGEPYFPRVTEAEYLAMRPGRDTRLDFVIWGKGAEVVTALAKTGSGRSSVEMSKKSKSLPLEPTYRIVAPDGEIATSGSFEYG